MNDRIKLALISYFIFLITLSLFGFFMFGILNSMPQIKDNHSIMLWSLPIASIPAILFYFYKNKSSFLNEFSLVGKLNGKIIINSLNLYINIFLSFIIIIYIFKDNLYLNEIKHNTDFYSLITIIIIVPVLEEILFRQIILKNLLLKYKPFLSILIVSLMFSLAHFNNLKQVFFSFFLSIIFSVTFFKSKGLLLSIAFHCFNNFFVVFFLKKIIDFVFSILNKSIEWTLYPLLVIFLISFLRTFKTLLKNSNHP